MRLRDPRTERAVATYTRRTGRNTIAGMLGNNGGTVDHPTRGTGWVYVRLKGDRSRVVVASDEQNEVAHRADLAVELEWNKGRRCYQVLGLLPGVYPDNLWGETVGYHAAQHERREFGAGGPDALDVYTRALTALRARAQETPDLTVYVERGFVPGSTLQWYAGGTSPAFDTVTTPPYNANVRMDLVFLWPSTLTLEIAEGTEVAADTVFDDVPKVACPSGAYPLAYVWRYSGQPYIEENCLFDARPLGSVIDPVNMDPASTGQVYYIHNVLSDQQPEVYNWYLADPAIPSGVEKIYNPHAEYGDEHLPLDALTAAGVPGLTSFPTSTIQVRFWAGGWNGDNARFGWRVLVYAYHLDGSTTLLGASPAGSPWWIHPSVTVQQWALDVTIDGTPLLATDRLLFRLLGSAGVGAAEFWPAYYFDGATYLSRFYTGLSGALEDHAASHQAGGGDAIDGRQIERLLGWWNAIEDGGLAGDGATDDTAALQTLIDTVAAAGGGTIFFPIPSGGSYKIAGALQDAARSNAQILLPRVGHYAGDPITIRFLGEEVPSMNFAVISSGGLHMTEGAPVKLQSTLGAGTGAMVGAWGPAVGSYEDFTHIQFVCENLLFEMVDNPTNSCLDLSHVARVELRNVKVKTPAGSVDTVVEPTTATSYGVKLPLINNAAWTKVCNLQVDGFYNGVAVTEHADLDNIFVNACKVAFEFLDGIHASLLHRVLTQECCYNFKFTGGSHYTRVLEFASEHEVTPGHWYTFVRDIEDAGNLGYGDIHYLIWTSGMVYTAITKSGGSHLNCIQLGDPEGVSDHGALSGLADDDHTQYQLRTEKGAPSGYASLDGTQKVPTAQLGSGVAGATKWLRGDRSWQEISTSVTGEILVDNDGNILIDNNGNVLWDNG